MTRTYRMNERAERQRETRRRIVEAAVQLHGTVGPAVASISAIAEAAGVTRPTVYAHFPDLRSLFEACSAHSMAADPPPDPAAWTEESDPERRLRQALGHLYRWYRRNRATTENVLRDAETVPALAEAIEPMRTYLATTTELLVAGWTRSPVRRRRVRLAVGHAIDFHAWRSLADRGATDDEAADLLVTMVRAVGDGLADRTLPGHCDG